MSGDYGSQVDSLFDKTNIFKEFSGRQCHPLKGDMLIIKKARVLAQKMKFDNFRLVVFLGLMLPSRLTLLDVHVYQTAYMTKDDKLSIGIVLPHPSGFLTTGIRKKIAKKATKVLRTVMKKAGLAISNTFGAKI